MCDKASALLRACRGLRWGAAREQQQDSHASRGWTSAARSEMQTRILTRIGADAVITPEDEAADRWLHRLLAPFIIDHVELGKGYALVQLPAPNAWAGKTLADLDLRHKHNVTVVAIKRRSPAMTESGAEVFEDRIVDLPQPTSQVNEDDVLILAGFDRDVEKLPR